MVKKTFSLKKRNELGQKEIKKMFTSYVYFLIDERGGHSKVR
jgi:hypothetical protein